MLKHLFRGYPVKQEDSEEHQNLAIKSVAIVSMVVVVGFIVVNLFKARYGLVVVEFISFILFALSVLPIFKNQSVVRQNIIVAASSILLLGLLIDGGVAKVAIFWSLLIPFIACLFLGLPKAWYWIGFYAVVVATIFALHLFWKPFLPYNNSLLVYFPFLFLQFSLLAAILQSQFEWSELKYQRSIEDLDGLSRSLEEQVSKRTQALEVMNTNLKEEIAEHDRTTQALHSSEIQIYQMQKMETIGTLVGGIAHDFNNMLAGINANMFMIKRRVTDDEDLLKRTQNVESLVKSASDMVRQLLTFARKDHVEFEYFNLVEHVDASYKLLQVAISEHIQMNLTNDAAKLPVYASQTQIQQVIMNMVNNARDATAKLNEPIIQINVEACQYENKPFALISIADNGEGIPEEELEKIFEPFFTTKEVGKGTGLGLAMSFGAIQSHSGSIEVSSIVGKGTVFKIYLPLSADDKVSSHVETITQGNVSGHETILLADDDQRLRESQRDVLESLGYHMLEAENGKEAVRIYAEERDSIDLVVLDLTMPVMGGVQAAKKIRELSSDVKILFITGYDMDSTINGGDALEPREIVLEKPFTMKKFHHQVREYLMK